MEWPEIPETYRHILAVFKKHLPTGDALKLIADNLGYKRKGVSAREGAYKSHMQPILAELGESAEELLIDFLVHPANHHIPWKRDDEDCLISKIAPVLISVHCEHQPTQYAAEALMQRLQNMLESPLESCEIESSWHYTDRNFIERYHFPKAHICLRILLKHAHLDQVKSFLLSVFQGNYNKRLDFSEDDYQDIVDSCHECLGSESAAFDTFTQQLFDADELNYAWFAKANKVYPEYLNTYRALQLPQGHDDYEDEGEAKLNPAYKIRYVEYALRFIREQVADLPNQAEYVYIILHYEELSGIEWLKAGLQHLSESGLKAKDLRDEYDETLAGAIKVLIGIVGLANNETEDDLIKTLTAFKEAHLLLALPYANHARNAILKALDWDDLLPIQQQVFTIAGGSSTDSADSLDDVYNCTNPESGVINRADVKAALDNANEKRLAKYIKTLKASSLAIKNTLMLINAVMGIERDKIEQKLVRHSQAPIKAYGLYEVESEEELRRRYLHFKTMHKEATQYGSERQLNTQAAVKAGLKNLAQSAGYTDEIRMEWALEADIATNVTPLDTPIAVDEWSIKLVLEGITPRIEVSKQDKPLKSVPPKVRKTEAYKDMRETQDNIRGQASRFRKTLEDMMCGDEPIAADELNTLSSLPVVRAMLSQLIMQASEGEFGLFTGETDKLNGLDGEVPIKGGLRIAHVYHLFQANVLSQWQKAIVHWRIVQPFKQAFRELYIVTPAEIEVGTKSRRFVGHVVDSSVASRLLQSRNWSQSGGDGVEVYKRFPGKNMHAEIGFPDAHHFLSEYETTTIDEIWFYGNNDYLPLESVDPIIFTEVMRDVDLIASVAQVGDGDVRWSTETALRRTELITTLMSEIGLKQVRCEDHFAHIEGKLANYRIHLGSGVIHIQPGNYLCIIPEPKDQKKEDPIYLPFADADMRMSEIISKIFLLMNDDRIKDKSILEQIKYSTKA